MLGSRKKERRCTPRDQPKQINAGFWLRAKYHLIFRMLHSSFALCGRDLIVRLYLQLHADFSHSATDYGSFILVDHSEPVFLDLA